MGSVASNSMPFGLARRFAPKRSILPPLCAGKTASEALHGLPTFCSSHDIDGIGPVLLERPQADALPHPSQKLASQFSHSLLKRNGLNKAGSWEAKGEASSAEQNRISKPGDSHRQAMSAGCRGWCSRGTGYSTHAARKKRDTLLS